MTKDEKKEEREGVEKARKVSSLGPAVSRRLAILRCDIRAEKVAVSSRTLKYIREERENDETLCESEEVVASRSTRYSLARCRLSLKRFFKNCG